VGFVSIKRKSKQVDLSREKNFEKRRDFEEKGEGKSVS
jgi:hypothetical protein